MRNKDIDMENQGEIILYQPDEVGELEVRLEDETVWLTQAQIAELFGTEVPAVKNGADCYSWSYIGRNSKKIY